MECLGIYLSFLFSFSIFVSHLKFTSKTNSFEIVNKMGIGYNLANLFDSYQQGLTINSPMEQITLNGNPFPTKQMIKNIKKYGFKTIRFPVTWINFIDEHDNIDPEWMSLVKNLVNLIIKRGLYCILNIHGDGHVDNWLSKGLISKNRYINLWRQIAEEFKDFNNYLIFESMDETIFLSEQQYLDYEVYHNFSQYFVDIIRNSSSYNKERLLIIDGINSNLESSCNDNFKMPIDPYNNLALSLHYFLPYYFVESPSGKDWGNEGDFSSLIENFEKLKYYFIDKGYPVILTQIGVFTELDKEVDSIRLYLHSVFALSIEKGIAPCLWDTSNKNYGQLNCYNRETDQWYDSKIEEIFSLISKGNYVKPSDYYILTNKNVNYNEEKNSYIDCNLLNKVAKKIILNTNIKGKLSDSLYDIFIYCFNSYNDFIYVDFTTNNMKRQYDGTCLISIDMTDKFCDSLLSVEAYSFDGSIKLNNLTIEFNESFSNFEYFSFKSFFF